MNVSDPQANPGDSGKPAPREPDQTVLIECPDPALRAAPVAPEPALRRRAYLIVMAGHSIGKTFKLAGATVIGRAVDCGICLDDEGVSREHARVEQDEQGHVWIADLGSTNGTYFSDGRRIDRHVLQDGDKVRIGPDAILKLSYPDGLEEDFYRHQYDSATKDALTGIYNKRYFLDQLKSDFAHARRQRNPLSLIAFDLDHFKQINDVHGHPAGDYILRELAGVVGRALRGEDWFARVGGEEFAIIERAADESQVLKMAERIRRTVEAHRFAWEAHRIPVTISLGVATLWGENFRNVDALVRAADEFLYRAKHAGRNRVVSALG
ncbi:MAG: diguanylate cyclase [Kiritimatiellia bacterium]